MWHRVGHTLCSYGALAGLDTDTATRDALCAEATQLLDPYCGTDGLEYPITAVMAYARSNGEQAVY